MQAIGLVTGDEFLVPFNLTIDTDDVLNYMVKLFLNWTEAGFTRDAYFDDEYGINFAAFVGSTGFCYNFNLADADELFNLKM
jgi:hypothetical protein